MNMNKVFSGHQPNFIPYMGFFYKMFKSDIFVLDDDVKYSSKGLHNSNFIIENGERKKITVPVTHSSGELINEIAICYDRKWDRKMLRTIEMNYRKCEFFEPVYDLVKKEINKKPKRLADLNISLIIEIAKMLGISSKVVIASQEVPTKLTNNERNVFQCKTLGCSKYYSGTGGKSYNDEEMYKENGIEVIYSDYVPVEIGEIKNLSVIDYLFHKGFVLPERWKRNE